MRLMMWDHYLCKNETRVLAPVTEHSFNSILIKIYNLLISRTFSLKYEIYDVGPLSVKKMGQESLPQLRSIISAAYQLNI
jgi:hypothetical protein